MYELLTLYKNKCNLETEISEVVSHVTIGNGISGLIGSPENSILIADTPIGGTCGNVYKFLPFYPSNILFNISMGAETMRLNNVSAASLKNIVGDKIRAVTLKDRGVVLNGKLHIMPDTLLKVLFTSMISSIGKIRIIFGLLYFGIEKLLWRLSIKKDEEECYLSEKCNKVFGYEFTSKLIAAMCNGISSAKHTEISSHYIFPSLSLNELPKKRNEEQQIYICDSGMKGLALEIYNKKNLYNIYGKVLGIVRATNKEYNFIIYYTNKNSRLVSLYTKYILCTVPYQSLKSIALCSSIGFQFPNAITKPVFPDLDLNPLIILSYTSTYCLPDLFGFLCNTGKLLGCVFSHNLGNNRVMSLHNWPKPGLLYAITRAPKNIIIPKLTGPSLVTENNEYFTEINNHAKDIASDLCNIINIPSVIHLNSTIATLPILGLDYLKKSSQAHNIFNRIFCSDKIAILCSTFDPGLSVIVSKALDINKSYN